MNASAVNPHEISVKELLSSRDKWTQGALAVKRNVIYDSSICKVICDPNDPEACKWCLKGALIRCYGENTAYNIGMIISRHLGCDLATFNDSSTYDSVMNLVDEFKL